MSTDSLKETSITEFSFSNTDAMDSNTISLFNIGVDAFTTQLIGYSDNNVSVGINTRLEEELPYEDTDYDYKGFYYLDFSFNYSFKKFSIDIALENILDLSNPNYAIEPNVETFGNITQTQFLSQANDTQVSITLSYNF